MKAQNIMSCCLVVLHNHYMYLCFISAADPARVDTEERLGGGAGLAGRALTAGTETDSIQMESNPVYNIHTPNTTSD